MAENILYLCCVIEQIYYFVCENVKHTYKYAYHYHNRHLKAKTYHAAYQYTNTHWMMKNKTPYLRTNPPLPHAYQNVDNIRKKIKKNFNNKLLWINFQETVEYCYRDMRRPCDVFFLSPFSGVEF